MPARLRGLDEVGISGVVSQVGEIEKVEAITALVDRVCGLAD
jgi:hypothetical protein